ncbi:MAG: PQQ-binding-like beta-propeller repeat protein [Planctomycetota bacterium]
MMLSAVPLLLSVLSPSGSDWPQFRGPLASGVRSGVELPEELGEPAWRVDVPGLSHASPVVLGSRVFVATAIPTGITPELKVGLYGAGDSAEDLVETEFRLLAFDVGSGEKLWDTLAAKTVPQFGRHTKATQANSTPAATGDAVVAVFGSAGLFCFDAASGEQRWRVDLGPLDCGPPRESGLHWGYASSPVVHDGRVVVQVDVQGESYLAAFALEDGKEVWRTRRDDVDTWCTPTILPAAGERPAQVLVNGSKHIGAYRFDDGAELWHLSGGGGIPVPTPVVSGDLVYFTSNHRPLEPSHPQQPVFAVRLSAEGDLGVPDEDDLGEHMAWMAARRGNYMQTPIVYDGLAWFCKDDGIVTCFDAETGEEFYRERLGEGRTGFTASPVAGYGMVYFTSEEGDVYTVSASDEFEVIAHSELGDICMTTPAIVDDGLVFRTQRQLMRFDP